ncbi:MAG: YqgE/AlgH family protein [Tannerellaceae bacterium]|jgi:putative transcriptional regulator|nr:YqgE/AlgH family protein [Tannerellaceae bacterium]
MKSNGNVFNKVTHNNLLPSQGRILISEPSFQDAYFRRSVVLLVDHNSNGSMGFVLNKKTNLFVNIFFPELEKCHPMPIYLGGPVSTNRLFFIHTLGDTIIPDALPVGGKLFFDGDFNVLKQYILNDHSIEGKVKFFLGYSGWTGGQLEREIDEYSWVVGSPNCESILSADGESYWKTSLARMGKHYRTWINFPKDPLMN